MVTNKQLPVIWDKEAKTQLKKAYNKILKESYQGAITVRDGILDTVDKIPEQPIDIRQISLKLTIQATIKPLNCIITELPTK